MGCCCPGGLRRGYNPIVDQVDDPSDLNTNIVALRKSVEDLKEVCLLLETPDYDCYDYIAEKSKGSQLRREAFLSVFHLNSTDDLACMVTGICANDIQLHPSLSNKEDLSPTTHASVDPVTLAHILPRSCTAIDRKRLDLAPSSIDSVRNCLLLCKGLEEAFDRKLISFVPTSDTDPTYVMRVWSTEAESMLIYPKSTHTIGFFKDRPLMLTQNGYSHRPYNRALAYQAFRSYLTSNRGPNDLPIDSDISPYNGTFKVEKKKSLRRQKLLMAASGDSNTGEDQI